MKIVDFSSAAIFSYFLVFCRISSSFFLIPGIGEINIPSRIKLMLGLAIAFLIVSLQKDLIPAPTSTIEMLLVIISEISIGVTFGLMSKIILSSVYIAGHSISSSIGLSTAMMFDPNHSDQSTAIGVFLNIVAVIIIIKLNLHMAVIDALIRSYETLPIGSFFKHYEGFSELIIKAVATAWNIGIRFSAPFIIASLLIYLGAGVLSRLMPQLQVFFLLLPAQVLVGFIMLMLFVSSAMLWFIDEYKTFITEFMGF